MVPVPYQIAEDAQQLAGTTQEYWDRSKEIALEPAAEPEAECDECLQLQQRPQQQRQPQPVRAASPGENQDLDLAHPHCSHKLQQGRRATAWSGAGAQECGTDTISSSLDASVVGELLDLADTSDTTRRESNNFLNNLGSPPGTNVHPAGHDCGPEGTGTASSASICDHWAKAQENLVENNKWQIVAEIHQVEDLPKENTYVTRGNSQSCSTPQQGTKEGPAASYFTPELSRTQRGNARKQEQDEGEARSVYGEENQLNNEKGAKGRPDHIINTINASLLAVVEALIWQSHKMEIHLELTHMLAQSVLALDNKLNLLSGKLDKLGNTRQVDKMSKGTHSD
ncbi:hypothetical protein NDU88_002759 [Pleurodeles waltl]|uniref:Uncharacterized protein n=1 Tax=Pleurodeles waltl TaxID=8319 RepID=A0AAV7VDE2_PLEWA|nr:hypothetical protein NDU88_002759 [Pleurodeles waltl]